MSNKQDTPRGTDLALLIFCLALFGAGMISAGVFILAGPGWCLIASGLIAVCAAAFLRRGLTNG